MKKEIVYPVLLVIVSLVAGLAIGLTLARKPRHDFRPRLEKEELMDYKHKMKGDYGQEKILNKICTRLNLSESQSEQVKNILNSSKDEARSTFKATKENLGAIKEKTNAQIRAILSKTQQVEFDKMISEMKGKAEKFKQHRCSSRELMRHSEE